jgi:hypothetical protein
MATNENETPATCVPKWSIFWSPIVICCCRILILLLFSIIVVEQRIAISGDSQSTTARSIYEECHMRGSLRLCTISQWRARLLAPGIYLNSRLRMHVAHASFMFPAGRVLRPCGMIIHSLTALLFSVAIFSMHAVPKTPIF